jgi:NADH dehydrogenase
MPSLLITGWTGFIGRRLLERLDASRYERIYCVSRGGGAALANVADLAKFEFIRADILEPKLYEAALAKCETVLHLAALTGKRPPAEYFRVNHEGTKILLDECKRAGLNRFIYISTIAAKFADKSHYHYAQSKELAEAAVRQSGLAYTIVRPTIVIGVDSPVWKTFSKLGKLPVTPIFGDGSAKIQPIHVDDLVECLLSILKNDELKAETIELGGPEQTTFGQFLTSIHALYHPGQSRTLHIPLRPMLMLLSLLEKPFRAVLPVTAGQLCAFYNDSTIEPNSVVESHKPQMKSIDQMLCAIRDEENKVGSADQIDRECAIYTAYLIGTAPDSYILSKYREAHRTSRTLRECEPTARGRRLIGFSCRGPFFASLADTYSRFFCPRSLLRMKLVLLLGILECSPSSYEYFDKPDPGGIVLLLLSMFVKGLLFAVRLMLAMILLLPMHLASLIFAPTPAPQEAETCSE